MFRAFTDDACRLTCNANLYYVSTGFGPSQGLSNSHEEVLSGQRHIVTLSSYSVRVQDLDTCLSGLRGASSPSKQAMKNLCLIHQPEASDIYITEGVAAIDQAHETQNTTVGLGFSKPFKALSTRPNLMWRLFL